MHQRRETTAPARFWSALGAALIGGATASAAMGGDDTLHLTLVTNQISRPVYAISPPGDLERLFVLQQWSSTSDAVGRMWLLKNGLLLPEPFLELCPVAINFSTGLLCVAFEPDYATNGIFYVLYTNADGHVLLSRFVRSADPDVADPASEQVLLTILQPHRFHNGGWMEFGPDGYLYLSSGDGGPEGDPDHTGQDPDSLLGKILRIDVHGDDFPEDPLRNYAIPPDNPLVGQPGRDEIWALGLREPWRCSFDEETGDLFIADVGYEGWEELNIEPAGSPGGANYGWRCREGAHPLFGDPECDGATFTEPTFEYAHGGTPNHCSIIGGYVYHGHRMPELAGRYIFGDWCSSAIWSFRYEAGEILDFVMHDLQIEGPPGTSFGPITSFGRDACGELYVTTHSGQLFRMSTGGAIADCNGDGIEDGCEIALGLASDANGNGVPDRCEAAPCAGDLDGSGAIDVVDLVQLIVSWGPCPGCPADVTGDGTVDVSDLVQLILGWGPCRAG